MGFDFFEQGGQLPLGFPGAQVPLEDAKAQEAGIVGIDAVELALVFRNGFYNGQRTRGQVELLAELNLVAVHEALDREVPHRKQSSLRMLAEGYLPVAIAHRHIHVLVHDFEGVGHGQ